MELLEGIGDEVVIFITTTSLVFIVSFIWLMLPAIRRTVNQTVQRAPAEETAEIHEPLDELSIQDSQAPLNNNTTSDTQDSSLTSLPNANGPIFETDGPSTLQDHVEEHTSETSKDEHNAQKLRQQRLRFFEHQKGGDLVPRDSDQSDDDDDDEPEFENEPDNVSSSSPPPAEPLPNNAFHIRLKYLNDTERLVYAIQDEEVKEFKRRNFPHEVEGDCIIHLIYNGQVLRPDNRRMNTFGLTENCVVHVHIAQAAPREEPTSSSTDSDLELGHLMWPLFACILGIIWMLHFQYSELFTPVSSVALTILTGLFAMVVWNNYNQQQQQQQQ